MPCDRGHRPATIFRPCRPAQDEIVVRVDPLTLDQLLEQSPIEAAGTPVIDILDCSVMAQPGMAQPCAQPLVTSDGDLAVEQKTEPFGVTEAGGFGIGVQLGERAGHACKTELVDLIEGRMVQHEASPCHQWKYPPPRMLGWRIGVGSGLAVPAARSSRLSRMDLTEP